MRHPLLPIRPMDQRRRSGRLRRQDSAALPNRPTPDDDSTEEQTEKARTAREDRLKTLAKRSARNAHSRPRLHPGNAFATTSPVKKMDLQAMFAQMIAAWPNLSPESQRRLLHVLPGTSMEEVELVDEDEEAGDQMMNNDETKLRCPITATFVAEDDIIRRDVARFKRDIEDGYYRKKWQCEGHKAMRDRMKGRFDAYIQEKAEKEFGMSKSVGEKSVDSCMDIDEATPAIQKNGLESDVGQDGGEDPGRDSMDQDTSSMEHKTCRL